MISETYQLPGQKKRAISKYTYVELLTAYKKILSDLEGAGNYEPVAVDIRRIGRKRGYSMCTLFRQDERFKNMKRKWLVDGAVTRKEKAKKIEQPTLFELW